MSNKDKALNWRKQRADRYLVVGGKGIKNANHARRIEMLAFCHKKKRVNKKNLSRIENQPYNKRIIKEA